MKRLTNMHDETARGNDLRRQACDYTTISSIYTKRSEMKIESNWFPIFYFIYKGFSFAFSIYKGKSELSFNFRFPKSYLYLLQFRCVKTKIVKWKLEPISYFIYRKRTMKPSYVSCQIEKCKRNND